MAEKRTTVFDVAAKAGVSKGTVDRVLHNRGEVSQKSIRKVRNAIEELNYEPNFHASLLATRKDHLIACILPEIVPGEYWEKVRDGFIAGSRDVSNFNITTKLFHYDQYSAGSFDEACGQLLKCNPSGVVIAPLFKNGAKNLVSELNARNIPYIYIDTKLEEGNYFAYYGMPMYKSGFLSAALLTERCPGELVREIAAIRIHRDKSRLSDPTAERRCGFNDYIREFYPECNVSSVFIDPSHPETIESTLEDFFSKIPDCRFIVMFNSRIHLVSDYLSKHPDPSRRVIGFDNLDANIEALRQGTVDILIAQHTEDQSRHAVSTLADYIIMHKVPAGRDFHMHMDILTKLNIEDY